MGPLRLALVPMAIAAVLAGLVITAPGLDLEEWSPAVATLLVFLGLGGGLCVALGASIRRLGRSVGGGERSE